jgi:two-component system chemotaxis response regulator CheY
MRFLVVDDSATMRRIVINSLQRVGFSDFVEASDGVEALERFDDSVDFVITDWTMPNMTGIEFTRALRANEPRQVPILMVTTRSVREDILQAVEAGVDNYIVKPFTPKVLKEKIDLLIPASAAN